MRKRSVPTCVTALALSLVAAGSARAGFVSWEYQWVRNGSVVTADKGGLGAISLTDAPSGQGSGSANILATHLQAFSSATAAAPDRFSGRTYSLTLFLMDDASHDLGSLTFTGAFTGTLTANGAHLANAFTGPASQTLSLGGHLYAVSLNRFTAPGAPGSGVLGSLGASVSVDAGTPPPPGPPPPGPPPGPPPPPPPPPVQGSPEPVGLVLAGLGFGLVGLFARRRRQV